MNTNHENLLANALRDVLTVAGVIRKGAEPNGAELLMFAEDYIKHQPVSSGEVSDLLTDENQREAIEDEWRVDFRESMPSFASRNAIAKAQFDHDNRPDSLIRQDERKLVCAIYDKYIELLNEELNETVWWAASHGWKSSRFEAGVECRKEIDNLKQGVNQ